jgi:hypothetical protein
MKKRDTKVAPASASPSPSPPTAPKADADDRIVDFSNASIYVPLMQAVFATCTSAAVSVLAVWVMPPSAVSAVRTLACCAATGGMLMYTPLRVGRAHGVRFLFSSLQPLIVVYLSGLVVEQLLHTCTSDPSTPPSVRVVVFHFSILAMAISGFMRAYAPLEEVDLPFIVTLIAVFVVAVFPPPAVALTGPLCQSVTLWAAAERMVRAFAFSVSYCITVYCCTRSQKTTSSSLASTAIVVSRSTAATIWILGCHPYWIILAVSQNALIVYQRVKTQRSTTCGYSSLQTTDDDESDAELCDAERGGGGATGVVDPIENAKDPVAYQRRLLKDIPDYLEPHDFDELERTGVSCAVVAPAPSSVDVAPPPAVAVGAAVAVPASAHSSAPPSAPATPAVAPAPPPAEAAARPVPNLLPTVSSVSVKRSFRAVEAAPDEAAQPDSPGAAVVLAPTHQCGSPEHMASVAEKLLGV